MSGYLCSVGLLDVLEFRTLREIPFGHFRFRVCATHMVLSSKATTADGSYAVCAKGHINPGHKARITVRTQSRWENRVRIIPQLHCVVY